VVTKLRAGSTLPGSGRLAVLSRSIAAIVGGYAIASLSSVLMSLALPASRPEAVQTGLLLTIPIWVAVWIWAFSARRVVAVWRGLAGAAVVMGALAYIARAGGAG
jgi:hypothetical protein